MLNLRNFLKKWRVEEGDYTHLGFSGFWGGKWIIPESQNQRFMELYSKAVNKSRLALAERKTPVYRFFVDIDFTESDYKILPDRFLQNLLTFYQTAITTICSADVDDFPAIISVRRWWKIHLNYPDLLVDNDISRDIRQLVIQQLDKAYSELHLSESWSKIIDGSIYEQNGLRMLGSVKDPFDEDEDPYKLLSSPTFTVDNQGVISNQSLTLKHLQLVSIRVPSLEQIPVITSTSTRKRITEDTGTNKSHTRAISAATKDQLYRIMDQYSPHFPLHELEPSRCRKCIKQKKEHYFIDTMDKYCPFMAKEHTKGDPPIYMHLSHRGICMRCHDVDCHGKTYPKEPIKLDPQDMQIIFNIKQLTNTTINSPTINAPTTIYVGDEHMELLPFEEDADKITILDDPEHNRLLLRSLNGTHFLMAELIYALYHTQYRCDETHKWWIYQNHRWCHGIMAQNSLKAKMSKDLVNLCTRAKHQYSEIKPEGWVKKHALIDHLIRKLHTSNYKKYVLSECCEVFLLRHPNFLSALDQNPELIGFTNGVYDLKEMLFREGRPEDLITYSTGYDYQEEYSPNHRHLRQFLEDIQPDQAEREYLLTFLATGLVGKHEDELFHVFVGKTRNGKSKLRDLISYTFGDYYGTVSGNMFTDLRPSSYQASPDIMNLKGRRIVISSEPETKKKLNTGWIKLLTGNDPIMARGLYQRDLAQIMPNFKLILLCNEVPDPDKPEDTGIWSRLRVVPFNVTFSPSDPNKSTHPNKTNKYLKQMDPTLGSRIKEWRQDFMRLLLEYYCRYKSTGLNPTPIILRNTGEYRTQANYFLNFMKECTEEVEGNIHTSTLYIAFKDWYQTNCPGQRVPSNRKFVAGIKEDYKVENVKVNGRSTTGLSRVGLLEW